MNLFLSARSGGLDRSKGGRASGNDFVVTCQHSQGELTVMRDLVAGDWKDSLGEKYGIDSDIRVIYRYWYQVGSTPYDM